MNRTLLFITSALGMASLLSIAPAAALDLLSAGWAFSPASPGPCPNPGEDYDCYEDRTASTITLVGSNSISGTELTTFSYTLSSSDGRQTTFFNYDFQPDLSSSSVAYYQINSSPRSLLGSAGTAGSGSISPFVLNPGDTLSFGVDQNGDAAFAGTLAISSFSSTGLAEPVPAPLPILGASSAFAFSRRLRRRTRAIQQPSNR